MFELNENELDAVAGGAEDDDYAPEIAALRKAWAKYGPQRRADLNGPGTAD